MTGHRKGGREGGYFFFFSFLWLRFFGVMDMSPRGSGRSRRRQSQRSSDLVRNAAALYLFFFCLSLLRPSVAQCVYHCSTALKRFDRARGVIYRSVSLVVCGRGWGLNVGSFLSCDSRIPPSEMETDRVDGGTNGAASEERFSPVPQHAVHVR